VNKFALNLTQTHTDNEVSEQFLLSDLVSC